MAYWSLLCESTSNQNEHVHFGLTLDTSKMQWTTGAVVKGVFGTSSGKYVMGPGTTFLWAGNDEVTMEAQLLGIDGTTGVGASGTGLAVNIGIDSIKWKLDSK